MGNLGFHAVFRILATQPGVICERTFLPEEPRSSAKGGRARTPEPRTLETGRSPAEFDVLAFSISFEADYPNVVRILDAAGIPARAAERRASGRAWPLLLGGGPATFLNPEPIAPFFDLFLIGEAEEMVPEAFAGVGALGSAGASFEELLARFSAVEGAYRRDRYAPV
jgi:radical SAM superfamily enzyme YgiQ (UPF0313 family)